MNLTFVAEDPQSKFNRTLLTLLLAYVVSYIIFPKFLAVSLGFLYLSIDRMILFLLLASYLISLAIFKQTQLNLRDNYRNNKVFVWLILVISLIQLLSIYQSADFVTSLKRYLNHTLAILVPFFVLFSLNKDSLDIKKLGNLVVLALLFLIVILAIEFVIEKNAFENLLAGEALTEFQEQQLEAKMRGEKRRIQGTFANPLSLGQFILLIIPFLLFLKKYLRRDMLINCLIICLLFFSLYIKSRTVFILSIFLASVLGIYFLKDKKFSLEFKFWSVFAFLVLAVSVILFLPGAFNLDAYFGGHKLTEDDSRREQLVKGVPLVANSWKLGYGYGMGAETLGFGTLGGKSATVDNYFLTLALDSGLGVLLAFAVFYIRCVWYYFKVNDSYKVLYVGLLLFLINLFTLSLTEVHPIFYILLAVVLTRESRKELEAELLT